MENEMTDADMIGYVLDLLEPGERRSVEHYLSAHPDAAAAVDRLRTRLEPLSTDREPPQPPQGLALRTISRLAEYIVDEEPETLKAMTSSSAVSSSDQTRTLSGPTGNSIPSSYGLTAVEPSSLVEARKPHRRTMPGWLKPDLIVTACIGMVCVGLVVAGVGRTRHHMGVVACQDNLAKLHTSLVGYADNHGGKFPVIGDDEYPTAGHFSAILAKEQGDPVKAGFTWHDPADRNPDPMLLDAERNGWKDEVPGKVEYAYSLGYRGPDGKLLGLRKGVNSDRQPIASDLPSKSLGLIGAFSPHSRGHNVLDVGGQVRFSRSANLGIGKDDIYRNRDGRVSAGVHPDDSVLGRATDRP